MHLSFELLLVIAAGLLIMSVIASKFSDRFGIPTLVIFLAIGMLAGFDGPGGIYFDDPVLTQSLGALALVIILFSGGLDTLWKPVRSVMKEGFLLATLGVLITAGVVGLAAHWILNISLLEGMLLGAIVSSTDSAAVFSVLSSKGVRLRGKLKPLLELESGSNDPMAVFLTVGIIQLLLNPGKSAWELIPFFILQMSVGGFFGITAGKLLLFLINRLRLGYDGLYPVLVLGGVIFTYGATVLLGGSGFLAVYVLGVIMGREEFLHKRSLNRFYGGLAWLMQIIMFLTLGLLVFPSHMGPVLLPGLALAAILILAARPLSVFISMLPFKYSLREKTFISWVGLRGAVPIILGTYPRLAGLPGSDTIFNIVFFAVLASVLIQGTSIPYMARWLKVDERGEPPKPYPLEAVSEVGWKGSLRETTIPPGSWAVGKAIYQLGLPQNYLIILIARGEEFLITNGTIVIEAGDRLLALAEIENHLQVEASLRKPKNEL